MDSISNRMEMMTIEDEENPVGTNTFDNHSKDANASANKLNEVSYLEQKLVQEEFDFVSSKDAFNKANRELDEKEKLLTCTDSEAVTSNGKGQQIAEHLQKSSPASNSLETAQLDRFVKNENRIDQLVNELHQNSMLAEDIDNKYKEVSRKLLNVKDELEIAKEFIRSWKSRKVELEDILKIVDDEGLKDEMKTLHDKLHEAEANAKRTGKQVKRLKQKLNKIEKRHSYIKERYKATCDELKSIRWV